MAKKPGSAKKIPVQMELLSDDDRKALREEARKSVLAEMQQDARDAYFAEKLAEARRAHIPSEQFVSVTMDMAPFLPHIMIDGVQYFHGYTYDLPRSVACVIYEQMQRSWQHQDEIDGRSKFDSYRRPQGARLGPNQQGMPTRGANGIVTLEG